MNSSVTEFHGNLVDETSGAEITTNANKSIIKPSRRRRSVLTQLQQRIMWGHDAELIRIRSFTRAVPLASCADFLVPRSDMECCSVNSWFHNSFKFYNSLDVTVPWDEKFDRHVDIVIWTSSDDINISVCAPIHTGFGYRVISYGGGGFRPGMQSQNKNALGNC